MLSQELFNGSYHGGIGKRSFFVLESCIPRGFQFGYWRRRPGDPELFGADPARKRIPVRLYILVWVKFRRAVVS